jgi:hypothetical protein
MYVLKVLLSKLHFEWKGNIFKCDGFKMISNLLYFFIVQENNIFFTLYYIEKAEKDFKYGIYFNKLNLCIKIFFFNAMVNCKEMRFINV